MEFSCTRRAFIHHLMKVFSVASVTSLTTIAELRSAAQGAETTDATAYCIDAHAQLFSCAPSELIILRSLGQATSTILRIGSHKDGHFAICGARHAAGGQEFASAAPLLDVTGFNQISHLNESSGLLTMSSGCRWPGLIAFLRQRKSSWTFRQKQTGNDDLTIGGTLSANAHGQALRMKPIISDVESFDLIGADGSKKTCSRSQNQLLFRLTIGGYGNFGLISKATSNISSICA